MIPITVVDNFLQNPEGIFPLLKQWEFTPTDNGRWPGSRSEHISELEYDLFRTLAEKTLMLFYENMPQAWSVDMRVQKIMPFVEEQKDQFKARNRGYVHVDSPYAIIGILYLDKDPLPCTGTSFYRSKRCFNRIREEDMRIKQNHYLGEKFTDKEIEENMKMVNDQFLETMSVENVFNRLVIFNGSQWHAAQTFGYGNKPRHILNMFWENPCVKGSPLQRSLIV